MVSLNSIFQQLNDQHFSGELPLPILRWNSRLSSSAGRFTPGLRLALPPRPPLIEVAAYLRDREDGERHVRDTVLHEMVHFFLWHRRRPYGHTAEFDLLLKRVGGSRWNPVPKKRPYKHWYECPSCRKGFPTRRRLAPSACLPCCRRFNRGAYDARFQLVRKNPPGEAVPASGETREPEAPALRLSPAELIRRLEELKLLVGAGKKQTPPPVNPGEGAKS